MLESKTWLKSVIMNDSVLALHGITWHPYMEVGSTDATRLLRFIGLSVFSQLTSLSSM